MKKTVLVILAMGCIIMCTASMHHANQVIPSGVLKSFSDKYPQIHVKKWIFKDDTVIADFKMSGTKRSAYYLSNGNWIKTENDIVDVADLPKPVEKSWHECSFQTWYIEDMKHVETPDQNMYVFLVAPRAHFGNGYSFGYENAGSNPIEKYELQFNENGSLLKQVQLN